MMCNVEAKTAFLGKFRVHNTLISLNHSGRGGIIFANHTFQVGKGAVMMGLLCLVNRKFFIGEHIEKKAAKKASVTENKTAAVRFCQVLCFIAKILLICKT